MAVWPWAGSITSLCLSFLNCEMGIIIEPRSWVWSEDFLNNFIYFIVNFWQCWVFDAVRALSSCRRRELLSSCIARASHRKGVSCAAPAPGRAGFSSWGSQALEHRPSSCGSQAELPRGMWDLPGSGIEPVSPALAGRLFPTEPPGEPLTWIFVVVQSISYVWILATPWTVAHQAPLSSTISWTQILLPWVSDAI